MHAPEDHVGMFLTVLLLMEKDADDDDLHLLPVGVDSLLTGLDSHGDGWTLVLCLDQGEDVLVIHRRLWWEEVDVFEANASGDEYTDCPGVLLIQEYS